MTLRGATSLLVVVVAASSAAWGIHTTARAAVGPVPWEAMAVVLLPHVAAVAAAALVLWAPAWWRRAGLTYVAAFTTLEAVGLVRIVPFASQYATGTLVWDVATSGLALLTAVLAVVVLRDVPVEGDGSPAGPFRWAAVAAGLLLVAASVFATSVSSNAPAGRWTFTLGHASTGVLVGSLVGMTVVAGITAVVAASSDRALVVGAAAGLLASRPLAVSVLADRTWQDADAVLAAGWWITLVAQVLLVGALVALLAPRVDLVRAGRRQ